jgi:hypothetical protein
MSFYLKRTYVDNEPNIELVNIYYTWTPMNTPPNWEAHSETRVMPRGGSLYPRYGWNDFGRAWAELPDATEKIELPDDGVWGKILSLPNDVHDPSTGRYNQHYLDLPRFDGHSETRKSKRGRSERWRRTESVSGGSFRLNTRPRWCG